MKQFCEACQDKTYFMPSNDCITCYEITQVLSRHPRPRDLARDLIEAAQMLEDYSHTLPSKYARDKAEKLVDRLRKSYGIDPVPF